MLTPLGIVLFTGQLDRDTYMGIGGTTEDIFWGTASWFGWLGCKA